MPRGDGTGPAGFGPMTGRAAGFCAGYPAPGYMNPVIGRGGFGRGFGFFGRGRGRGFRNMYWATGLPGGYFPQQGAGNYDTLQQGIGITPEQQIDALKNQAKYMQDSLNAINEQIQKLETGEPEKKS